MRIPKIAPHEHIVFNEVLGSATFSDRKEAKRYFCQHKPWIISVSIYDRVKEKYVGVPKVTRRFR